MRRPYGRRPGDAVVADAGVVGATHASPVRAPAMVGRCIRRPCVPAPHHDVVFVIRPTTF